MNSDQPVGEKLSPSALDHQADWIFMSLHGEHEPAAEVVNGELILHSNDTRSGAMSRMWLPASGWETSLTLKSLSLPNTNLVLCFYAGIEYLPHSYENRIEFEIGENGIIVSASRRQFFLSREKVAIPAHIRVFCSMEGELTLLVNERPVTSFDQRILLQGAELLLYAKGGGSATVSGPIYENAQHPWSMAHPDAVPRSEFPNPLFRRDVWWQSLNGDWEFAFDPYENLDHEFLSQLPSLPIRIKVPFPWQSVYSGVHEPSYMGRAWYRRDFDVAEEAIENGRRLHLCFTAVDYEANVWVNGKYLGQHKGGYSSFDFDITEQVQTDQPNQLLVLVEDPRDTTRIPIGKQGTWYTRSSGIWQSVILQSVAATRLDDVFVTPDVDQDLVLIEGRIVNPGANTRVSGIVTFEGREVARGYFNTQSDRFSGIIEMVQPRLWSPEHPDLYDLVLVMYAGSEDRPSDVLKTYFGMRKISHNGRQFLLNDQPIYFFGALNQAFHPEGLYNYPDEETIRNDVIQAKDLGLNLFRVHIKVDDPRLYYWMDKLGMLVWQDLPCIDDRGYEPSTPEQIRDLNFPEDSAKFNMVRDAQGLIHRLRNHPCVVIYSIINEGWGVGGMYKEMGELDRDPERQAFLRRIYQMYRDLDPTRYVTDNSPCEMGYSHIKTDVHEYHFYANHIAHAKLMTHQEEYGPWREMIRGIGTREQLNNWFAPTVHDQLTDDDYNRPIFISEYGPWPGMPWHEQDISVFLKFLTHQLMLNPEIAGYVVTEYQDIEWERNGLVNYDRSPKRFGFDLSKMVFNPVIPLLDAAPFLHTSGESLNVPLYLSNYGRRRLEEVTIETELCGVSPFGFGTTVSKQRLVAQNLDFGLRSINTVHVPITNDFPVYWFHLQAMEEGASHGTNIFFIENDTVTQAQKLEPNAVNLEQFQVEADRVEEFRIGNHLEVLGFYDTGRMMLWLPEDTCPRALMMEISTCPEQLFSNGKHPEPAIVEVYFNETKIHEFIAPPARADFEGYMSQINSYRWGMYGELVTIMLSMPQCKMNRTNRIIFRTPSDQGLVFYSNRAGRYPTTPLMMF